MVGGFDVPLLGGQSEDRSGRCQAKVRVMHVWRSRPQSQEGTPRRRLGLRVQWVGKPPAKKNVRVTSLTTGHALLPKSMEKLISPTSNAVQWGCRGYQMLLLHKIACSRVKGRSLQDLKGTF